MLSVYQEEGREVRPCEGQAGFKEQKASDWGFLNFGSLFSAQEGECGQEVACMIRCLIHLFLNKIRSIAGNYTPVF